MGPATCSSTRTWVLRELFPVVLEQLREVRVCLRMPDQQAGIAVWSGARRSPILRSEDGHVSVDDDSFCVTLVEEPDVSCVDFEPEVLQPPECFTLLPESAAKDDRTSRSARCFCRTASTIRRKWDGVFSCQSEKDWFSMKRRS